MKKAEKKDLKVVSEKPVEVAAQPVARKKVAPRSHGVGRRKSSVARVWLKRGAGKVVVNDIDYKTYFDTEIARYNMEAPFRACQQALQFDFEVNINGGGKISQADAVKLGIARALTAFDSSLRQVLRGQGLLSVDSRIKERKKPGRKAARRRFQFVKR
jgi:small subunit ribosomal protein S9